jgi:Dyp-type peroxidase family
VNAHEARALIGFLDGTSNLDPAHSDDDRRLVFVDPSPEAMATYPATPPAGPQPPPQPGQPGYGTGAQGPIFPAMRPAPTHEPSWCAQGTYCFVQAVTMEMKSWDHTALASQEQVIGRFKLSGASLDLTDDDARRTEDPAFVTNPALETVAVAAHVRKVNPRAVADDLKRRVFRRGYPLIVSDGTGPTQRGLVFESFSRSTSTQIEFILKGWMFNKDFPRPDVGKDALVAFFSATLCGGYYFVPGLAHRHDPTSWVLPPAA